MGQVAINVGGRSYRFDCGDGEEARLKELAASVKGRVDTLVREYGSVGDERLMLMAALLITDELWDARAALEAAQKQISLKDVRVEGCGDQASHARGCGAQRERARERLRGRTRR